MRSLETKVMDDITTMQNQLNTFKTSSEGQGKNPQVAKSSGLMEVKLDLPKPKEFKGGNKTPAFTGKDFDLIT